ncbi:MAG: hypothetical protein IKL31_04495 [Ruminococcus sp.]|nr:hypothetical protein [Ruminococcus sp.]
MKNIFKFEWKRMIHSKTTLISAIVASLIVIADVIAWYKLYQDGIDVDKSVMHKWLGTMRGFNAGIYLFTLMPLITAFAYSWSVSYDRNSGYILQIISRIGRRKYFTAKYLVSFISGGMIFAGSLILDYMLLATFSPAIMPIPADLMSTMDQFHFCSAIYYQHPYLFVLIWLITSFLWGGAMACIGMAAGTFIKKYMISSLIPFLVFTLQSIAAIYCMQRVLITVGFCEVNLIWTEMLYAAPMSASLPEVIFSSIGFIITVTTLIYALRGRKYECL